jgi:CheY-like chemotaxis protein
MSSFHALIIDDDATHIHIMQKLLDREQVSSTAVIDATQVEAALGTLDRLDVVFLDLEMPRLTGYEVFEILKSILPPDIPIVACSVYTNEIYNTRQMGFFSFVAKPLDMDRFSNQLNGILHGEPVWDLR